VTLTIDLTPAMWLTSNRPIANHGQKARIVRAIHELVHDCARHQGLAPIAGRVIADWTIHYPKGVGWKHGDAANAAPTTKACLDALVPDWLEGDGPRFIAEERFRRGDNLDEPRWHRIVLRLIGAESA
jgi:hypothetical protein